MERLGREKLSHVAHHPQSVFQEGFCSNCIAVTLKEGLSIVLIFENCPPLNKNQLVVQMIKVKEELREV